MDLGQSIAALVKTVSRILVKTKMKIQSPELIIGDEQKEFFYSERKQFAKCILYPTEKKSDVFYAYNASSHRFCNYKR